jgi:hypothetical protein
VKSRTLGTVRLIAELYRKEVVREAIIIVCLRELLEVRVKESMRAACRDSLWCSIRSRLCVGV